MRRQWRLLLFRKYLSSHLQIPSQSSRFQLYSGSPRLLSSLLEARSFSQQQQPSIVNPQSTNPINPIKSKSPMTRHFSSEQATEQKGSDHVVITDVFNRLKDKNDIKKELESKGVVISHDLVLEVLKEQEANPGIARRFFHWVLESDGQRLSSKSYNLMLRILGVNGFVEEFWNLVDTMKKKGYGVSGHVRDKVSVKFEKDGLEGDLERLKGVFASGSMDNSMEKLCYRACKILKSQEWSDDVKQRLLDLNVTFSSDLVKMVLENLATEPQKALEFFRWIEETALFTHDEQTYNAVARVLGREDCIVRFWSVVNEARSGGFEMDLETFVKVLGRFRKRNMIKEAVELYEFAVAGANQPSLHCCTFLLKKIGVSKQLDMSLFSRVVKAFTGSGNVLTESMFKAVLRSLRSVGRFGECTKVLKAMEDVGLVVSGDVHSELALRLSRAGNKDKADEFEDLMEASENNLDAKTWASLVEGHCLAGRLEKASECFQKMVEKQGASYGGYAFERLVNVYCIRNRAIDASKLLHNYVNENQLNPWHSTYQVLIKKLLKKKSLVQGGFKEALNLLDLMKTHGFPPFIDPFIEYISKSGTSDDAVVFLKAMTSKRFPSTSVVLRVFEAYFKSSRHGEAQDLLSKCPGYIRNHADVLDLFYSVKSGKNTPVTAVAG